MREPKRREYGGHSGAQHRATSFVSQIYYGGQLHNASRCCGNTKLTDGQLFVTTTWTFPLLNKFGILVE